MPPARRFSMAKIAIVAVALLAPGCSSDSNHPIPDSDVPAIASLDPTHVEEGQGGFTLEVHGQGFSMDSVVRWNGFDRFTMLQQSGTEHILRASILQADVANSTTAQIAVFNPAPGGGISNTVNFVVYDPAALHPAISSVSPSSVTHGQDVTITVHGTGFVSGANVIWKPAATTGEYTETSVHVVSSTELTVVIQGLHIPNTGSATLKVVNPPPGSGTSGSETVIIL